MGLRITEEFISICKSITKRNKTAEEWSLLESDDMIQSESFVGGYDADEQAFCFSYYDENEEEFWFQVTLDEIVAIVQGTKTLISIRPAEA